MRECLGRRGGTAAAEDPTVPAQALARPNARDATHSASTASTLVIPTPRRISAGGTERVQLELGQPGGEVPIEITGGAKAIRIERPRTVPVRLRVTGGIGGIQLDGQVVGSKGGITTVDSAGWTGRGDRFAVSVVGGSKTIEVIGR